MLPLTLDDLLPLDEYSGKRRELFQSHCRYLDRYRRVRVGPVATLVFENRQTLWFRVQEVLHIARISNPQGIGLELELFNRLLPAPGQLQAALLITVQDQAHLSEELSAWEGLSGNQIQMCLGRDTVASHLLTARPEDRCYGTAHWVQFNMDQASQRRLADRRLPAALHISLPNYDHQSSPLSEDIRESLLDDLKADRAASRVAA